jgi:hypothetical protein
MKERLNELRLDAGIAQLKDDPRLVVIDREGNVIDPLIGLEKFAQLIVRDIHAYVDGMDTAQVISNGILRRYGVEE